MHFDTFKAIRSSPIALAKLEMHLHLYDPKSHLVKNFQDTTFSISDYFALPTLTTLKLLLVFLI
ncbi:MAG TPA: hypothetical protein PKH57_00055 [Bacteroidales bacterium]|nr:hypothetical protein [Bacteroidales bacterium]